MCTFTHFSFWLWEKSFSKRNCNQQVAGYSMGCFSLFQKVTKSICSGGKNKSCGKCVRVFFRNMTFTTYTTFASGVKPPKLCSCKDERQREVRLLNPRAGSHLQPSAQCCVPRPAEGRPAAPLGGRCPVGSWDLYGGLSAAHLRK